MTTRNCSFVSSLESTSAVPLRSVFEVRLLEERPGFISFQVRGKGAQRLFENESGGHRWQRTPPTEKRGRVHTSTITVATLREDPGPLGGSSVEELPEHELELRTFRGSGPGGQHKQKNETGVEIRHLPTGLKARVDGRSQHQNKQDALTLLKARIAAAHNEQRSASERVLRQSQVGTGMRGDKRRTIRQQDGTVKDHITGQQWKYSDYIKGNW